MSSEFLHALPNNSAVTLGRHPFIVDYCRGKRVLHIGCVDTGLLDERFAAGQLLHQKLDKVAERVVGIDINTEGLQYLRDKGFDDLHKVNIEDPADFAPLQSETFDVVVISEVVEHLQNVGLALKNL